MIIVTGTIRARPGTLEPLLAAARAHVARSRTEAGCIAHGVHVDGDDPLRLVFVERWDDVAALRAHATEPGTRDFMAAVHEHAAATEPLEVWEATPVSLRQG